MLGLSQLIYEGRRSMTVCGKEMLAVHYLRKKLAARQDSQPVGILASFSKRKALPAGLNAKVSVNRNARDLGQSTVA
jgi:hypothetical protein